MPPAWGKGNYGYRKKMTINNDLVSGCHSDFPILVHITDSDLTKCRSDGYDITFYDSGCEEELDFDRLYFDNTTGKFTAWLRTVKVSSSSTSEDNIIYMYYGKEDDTDHSSSEDVWPDSYLLACHMQDDEDNYLKIRDGSSYNRNICKGRLMADSDHEDNIPFGLHETQYIFSGLARYGMGADLHNPVAIRSGNYTFVSMHGNGLDPYMTIYDNRDIDVMYEDKRTLNRWATPVKVDDNAIGPDDGHGSPSMIFDASGHIHIFYGGHDHMPIQHAISDNPYDISSWTIQDDLYDGTYPHPALTENGTLYIFFRGDNLGGGNNTHYSFMSSNNNGESWTFGGVILDGGGSKYTSKHLYVPSDGTHGERIYIPWSEYSGHIPAKYKHVYLGYFSFSSHKFFYISGINGTSSQSIDWPLTLDEQDDYYRVYEAPTFSSMHGTTVKIDEHYNPMIVFSMCYQNGAMDNCGYWWTYYQNGEWSDPKYIRNNYHYNRPNDFILNSSTDGELFLMSGNQGDTWLQTNILRYTWDGNDWTEADNSPIIITSGVVTYPCGWGSCVRVGEPFLVENYADDFKLTLSMLVGAYSSMSWAWGDNGIISGGWYTPHEINGPIYKAQKFFNTGSASVDIGLTPFTEFTVTTFVKPTAISGSIPKVTLTGGGEWDDRYSYNLAYFPKYARMGGVTSKNNSWTYTQSDSVVPGNWYMFSVAVNNKDIDVYLNGDLHNSDTASYSPDWCEFLTIGCGLGCNIFVDEFPSSNLSGSIAELFFDTTYRDQEYIWTQANTIIHSGTFLSFGNEEPMGGEPESCGKSLKIYHSHLVGNDFICCDCSRWDVNDYEVVLETWLNKSQLQELRENTVPGAASELYKILDRPVYHDMTWQGNNTLWLYPNPSSDSELKNLRNDQLIFVKSIMEHPINKDWIEVKIEGVISGTGSL